MQKKTGLNIVFVSHAWQRKVESPGETNSYDHYELKLGKKAAPLLREWPDFLFFLNYDITIMKTAEGKNVASGGQRCIFTTHTPYYDAKSRAELPERLKLDEKGVAQVFKAMFEGVRREEPKAEAAPEPAEEKEPEQEQEPTPAAPAPEMKPEPKPAPSKAVKTEEWDPQSPEEQQKTKLLSDLDALLKAENLTYEDLELATSHPKINMRPKGTPISAFSLKDLDRLVNKFDAVKKTIMKIKGA